MPPTFSIHLNHFVRLFILCSTLCVEVQLLLSHSRGPERAGLHEALKLCWGSIWHIYLYRWNLALCDPVHWQIARVHVAQYGQDQPGARPPTENVVSNGRPPHT